MAYKKKEDEENQNETAEKPAEQIVEESPNEKVEIVKNGVTRIRARSEVPAYIAQGWKLK